MSRSRLVGWGVGLAVLALLVFLVVQAVQPKADEPDAPASAALVTLAPVRSAEIDDTVTAYGVVAGSPGGSRTVAAPLAVIVQRLLVAPGQPVPAGAPLIVVANTPAAELTYRQAADAATFAQRDLERVQRLYDARLAANDALIAARKAVADAQAAVVAQSAVGAGGGARTLRSPIAGVVGAVTVAPGDHVAEGAPLMTVIAADGVVAELQIDPARAARLVTGQTVRLTSTFDSGHQFESRLAVVGRQIETTSKMIEATAPVVGSGLVLGAAVRGRIVTARHAGLLAPRASVATDEDGAHVFVVRDGKAREVKVVTGEEQGDEIEVRGALKVGDVLAVDGAYQLEDGMAVRTAAR